MYTTIEKQYAEELIQNKRFLSPSFEVDPASDGYGIEHDGNEFRLLKDDEVVKVLTPENIRVLGDTWEYHYFVTGKRTADLD